MFGILLWRRKRGAFRFGNLILVQLSLGFKSQYRTIWNNSEEIIQL